MVVRATEPGGEVRKAGLDAAALPPARAEIGRTDHDGPRGGLVGRVEPDLILAVARPDRRSCRQGDAGSPEQKRNPLSHRDSSLFA